MRAETYSVERAGRAIFVRAWSPDGPARAVVQVAHGLAEHSARYARLAEALTQAGYAVFAHDHRGHGPNCPPRDLGFFAESGGWRACLDDIDAVGRRVANDHPGLARIFLGHSMGSFLGQTYIAEHGAELSAAVLSGSSGPPAPALALGRLAVEFERRRLGKRGRSRLVQDLLFGSLNRPFKPARTGYEWLSRDEREVDLYVADPLCGFPVTNQLAADLAGALRDLASPRIAARIPKRLPIYVFSGARDPVGAKLSGLIDVYRAAGLDVTTRIYPDARHEMLNELNRDEATKDLIAWLDRKMARV